MPNAMVKQTFRCLIIIVDANIRDNVTEFLNDSNIPIFYQMHGIGTVRSDFLNLLGLGNPQKSITLCFVPTGRRKLILAELNQALQLHKRGTGIAVSVPINGLQGWLYKLLGTAYAKQPEIGIEEKEVNQMNESITHAMILVTINQGYSDDVMCTARAAGATGGTILRGLKCSSTEAEKHFGLPIQEEQEILTIVVPADKKAAVMAAISKEHGISAPAHGIILSLPVDAIAGL